MPTRIANATVVDKCTQRVNALKDHVQPNAIIAVNGKSYTAAELIALYHQCLDDRAQLATLRADVKIGLANRARSEAMRRAIDRALKPYVVNHFGDGSKEARDFGFPPAKVTKPTPEEKARAVALGLATRAARHTMGPKQKREIKGTIPVSPAPAEPATHEEGQPAPHA